MKAYATRKTRVYFCTGELEHLEAECLVVTTAAESVVHDDGNIRVYLWRKGVLMDKYCIISSFMVKSFVFFVFYIDEKDY